MSTSLNESLFTFEQLIAYDNLFYTQPDPSNDPHRIEFNDTISGEGCLPYGLETDTDGRVRPTKDTLDPELLGPDFQGIVFPGDGMTFGDSWLQTRWKPMEMYRPSLDEGFRMFRNTEDNGLHGGIRIPRPCHFVSADEYRKSAPRTAEHWLYLMDVIVTSLTFFTDEIPTLTLCKFYHDWTRTFIKSYPTFAGMKAFPVFDGKIFSQGVVRVEDDEDDEDDDSHAHILCEGAKNSRLNGRADSRWVFGGTQATLVTDMAQATKFLTESGPVESQLEKKLTKTANRYPEDENVGSQAGQTEAFLKETTAAIIASMQWKPIVLPQYPDKYYEEMEEMEEIPTAGICVENNEEDIDGWDDCASTVAAAESSEPYDQEFVLVQR